MNMSHLLPPKPAVELAERLDGIFASIALFLFGRIQDHGALIARMHNRFARARRRLANLLALLAAGRLPRTYTPRPRASELPRQPSLNYPRRRAWLVATFGYRIAAYGSHLEHLLRDPQTLATLAAAPPAILKSAGRTLRPLCHLFGITLPPPLQRPPLQRPPRPKPPTQKPAAPPLPPLRPLHPRRYAREMPPLLPLRKNHPA